MQTKTHHVRSATTAIVAALALGSTALAAQTVTPPADPPVAQTGTPAATAPVVIVPDMSTAPTGAESPAASTSTPVLVSPVAVPQMPTTTAAETPPVQSETAPPPATQAAARESQPAAQAAETAVAAPAPRETVPTTNAPPSAPLAEEETTFIPPAPVAAPVAAVPPVVAAEPADPAGQTANQVALLTGVFFILLLLGLGTFTYVYWRRRSTAATVPTVVRPKVAKKQEQDSAARTTLTLETAAAIADEHPDAPNVRETDNSPETDNSNVAPIRSAAPQAVAVEDPQVALPASVPEKFEEREALIKRMVAAKPDKANPFRSRKARQRRARLILQSLAAKFDGREPWIDLSQYANNWPSTARRRNSFA